MTEKQRPPTGLRKRARDYWADTLDVYELSGSELELLREIVRTINSLDELDDEVRNNGAMVAGSRNNRVVNPAIATANQLRSTLGRLIAQLDFPDDSASPSVASPRSAAASKAASTRHALEREKADGPLRRIV